MTLPNEFLERIRAFVPIADVVARHVRLRKSGHEYSGLCPFHTEKTPSFTVSEDKGFYHCFGCGAHGDVISFVMRREGLSFIEAVEKLAAEAGLEMPRAGPEERRQERRRADLLEVVDAACDWFEEQLASAAGREARAYLVQRGLSGETVAAFRLGYAPNRRGALRQAMNARGIDDEQLAAAGLLKPGEDGGLPRDYFFDRVMFPITDRRGRVIAFGGRALSPEAKAKYLNSPDSALFHKGRVLYNLSRARRAALDTGELVVCEGYMDVIALAQAGFPAAVAPLGTAITEEQLRELWRLAAEPVVCLDGDEAGRRAGYRLVERALPALAPGYSLRFAVLPQGEDPDSLVSAQGPQVFRSVLRSALALSDLLWMKATEGRALDTPERRAGLRKNLLDDVARIADRDVREAYRTAMLDRFDAAFGYQGRRSRAGKGDARARNARRVPPPAGASPRPNPTVSLQRRAERVLLAALINHPGLLAEFAEELSGIELAGRDTDRIRRSLIDLAADRQDLDTVEIRRHLRDVVSGSALDGLSSHDLYSTDPFSDPRSTCESARRGVRHLLDLYHERAAVSETAEEGRRFADAMNPEHLARLQGKQEAVHEGESRRVDLDRDPAGNWREGS